MSVPDSPTAWRSRRPVRASHVHVSETGTWPPRTCEDRRMSHFSELASVDPHQIWAGVAGRVVDGAEATLAVIELEADAVVPEHSHVNEQLGVLVAGALTFTIGGETRE